MSRAVDGTAVRRRLVRISESRDCRSVGSRFPLEEAASAAAAGKSHSRHGDRHPRLAPSLQAYLMAGTRFTKDVLVCVSAYLGRACVLHSAFRDMRTWTALCASLCWQPHERREESALARRRGVHFGQRSAEWASWKVLPQKGLTWMGKSKSSCRC